MTHRVKTAWIERCAARLLVLRPSLLSEQALRLARERWEHQSLLDPEEAANSELRWEDSSEPSPTPSRVPAARDLIEGPSFRMGGLTLQPLAMGSRHEYFAAARIEGVHDGLPCRRRPVWTGRSYLHPSEALEAARWLSQALVQQGLRRSPAAGVEAGSRTSAETGQELDQDTDAPAGVQTSHRVALS
ncbi:hypothetical protein OOT46_04165 [Aquabacterium sp. A7-Y]|uniref:hypothetical protein n=1 Tax=Aquabacterium sp. A7-Y TaxID=1349605 RepID=UPI00223DD835|nr:hypothetical protein [Aquabacterium sp. A7-Y]MCW7537046.1 hypothetical protein [Aquabacterium sp. A7-Y]